MYHISYAGLKKRMVLLLVTTAASIFLCSTIAAGQEIVPFSMTSTAFKDGQAIPSRYTCTGTDTSPSLSWKGLPRGTVSLALIVDDPDAPGKPWAHWVLYRIDPGLGALPEGAVAGGIGAYSGVNDFKTYGYRGPCPPAGSGNHHYIFTLYALSEVPELGSGATKNELLSAIKDYIIDETTLTGLYSR